MIDSKRVLLLAAIIGLAGLVLLLDLVTPLGIAVWVLYLAVLLLSVRLGNRATLLTASGCSALIAVGMFLCPPGIPLGWELANRIMGLAVVWLTTVLALNERKRARHLAEANAALEREVSQRRQAEATLRDSEKRLRLALDAGEMGTWDWDLGSDALRWDHRLRELFGLLPEQFQGSAAALAAIHPEDRPRVEAAIARSVGRREPLREQFRVVHADASVRWLAALAQPLETVNGKGRLVGVTFDVTAHKRVEQDLERRVADRTRALHDREVRLRAILETASDAILTIDASGLIASVNPAAERLFGFTASEMVGQLVEMLLPATSEGEQDLLAAARAAKPGLERLVGTSRELQGRRKDGTIIPVELAISEVHDGQHWFIGILRDLGPRKELERQVAEVAAEEQIRISQELHDSVGQELTGLGLLAEALARKLQKSPTAEDQLAAKLVLGLERVQQQVRELCRGPILAELDAEGLCLALEELAVRTSEHSSIACHFDCPEPVSVADPLMARHLYRIAQEAMSNALRHGRPRQIRLALRRGSAGLCLTVEDDGIGMPALLPFEEEGMGIKTMRYRAGLIGGTLQIGPAEGGGTLVTCPVRRSNGTDEQ
jgi:PAS domain S-box-containing protein